MAELYVCGLGLLERGLLVGPPQSSLMPLLPACWALFPAKLLVLSQLCLTWCLLQFPIKIASESISLFLTT